MKMTIDEAINGVEKRILPIFDNDADHQALVMALDTMRKYQQIQRIYSDVLENNDETHFLEDVSEVLEDGNN